VATFLFNNLKPNKMNSYSKILIAVILSSLLAISSCKKEEIIIEGCTESTAMNYNATATSNDGSCILAYEIAIGIWNISSECADLTITIFEQSVEVPLNEIFPETIEITGEEDGVVSLDVNENSILADVANNGVVTIQDNQTISFDTDSFDPTGLIGVVEVDITGSGTIVSASNGNLSLTLSFEIPLAGSQSSTCEIAFSR
tara:strand:+ start:8303 stop:8905 length:603 start_codon:yes stop_codon:yes gene_type:complete